MKNSLLLSWLLFSLFIGQGCIWLGDSAQDDAGAGSESTKEPASTEGGAPGVRKAEPGEPGEPGEAFASTTEVAAAAPVSWELWRDWPGDSVEAVLGAPRWETEPIRATYLPNFESGRDIMDDFGVRLQAVLHVPATGSYRFVLETSGSAALFLGEGAMSETPDLLLSDARLVSEPILLDAGQAVRLTVLHKAGEGPDALRLLWQPPAASEFTPFPRSVLERVEPAATYLSESGRQAFIRVKTRQYDRSTHLARDSHQPRADQHLTRETVYAAGALLESLNPEDWAEAARALQKVLPYQNVSEGSFQFGNWPKIIERPGDFNAQNIGGFIGEELIVILMRHRDRLPLDVVEMAESALRRAALRSVRYDPPVTATNIVTKAVAVALLADQMLDIPEAHRWGVAKMEALHAHTMVAGVPTEYNSPTYNRVTTEALGLLLQHLQDAALKPMIEALYEASWRELALNYHPNLQLWAGASVRRYKDSFTPGDRLQEGTGNALFFGQSSFERVSQPVPERSLPYFRPLDQAQTRSIPILPAMEKTDPISQESIVPQAATVHMEPTFALSSFNRSDLWSQRRPVIAHWGRSDAPGLLRLISPSTPNGLLPLQIYTAQEGSRLLMVLNLATDMGWGYNPWDLHSQDRQAPVMVRDVRVRFLSEGPARIHFDENPTTKSNGVTIYDANGIALGLRLLGGIFGDTPAYWDGTPDGHLDLILYKGKPIPLDRIDRAYAALALEVKPSELNDGWLQSVSLREKANWVQLRSDSLEVRALTEPASYEKLQQAIYLSAPNYAAESITPTNP